MGGYRARRFDRLTRLAPRAKAVRQSRAHVVDPDALQVHAGDGDVLIALAQQRYGALCWGKPASEDRQSCEPNRVGPRWMPADVCFRFACVEQEPPLGLLRERVRGEQGYGVGVLAWWDTAFGVELCHAFEVGRLRQALARLCPSEAIPV